MSNWVLFIFIVRVILVASKTKAEKMGDSSVKMRTVSLNDISFKLSPSILEWHLLFTCLELSIIL